MRRKIYIPIVAIIVLALIGVFVSQYLGEKGEETYKIGAILPLTGNLAFVGEPQRNAIMLALDEIKQNVSRQEPELEVIFGDSKGEPKEGITLANRFISLDNVDLVISTLTRVALPIQPITEKNGVPLFVVSLHPEIVEGGSLTFRVFYNARQEAEKFLEFIKQKRFDRIAILYQKSQEAVQEVEKYLIPGITALGGKVVASEEYEVGQKEFRTPILKINDAEPDLLIVLGFANHFTAIFKAVEQFKLETQILGGLDFLDAKEFVGDEALDGVVFVAPVFDVAPEWEKGREFVEKYTGRYGSRPSYNAAYLFDTIMIINEVFGTDGRNASDFRQNLLQLGTYDGVTGAIEILPNGDTNSAIGYATFKEGEVVPYSLDESASN